MDLLDEEKVSASGASGGDKWVPEPLDWFPEGETCCGTLHSLGLCLSRGFSEGSSEDSKGHCPLVFPLGPLSFHLFLSVCRQVQTLAVEVDFSLSSDWACSSPALKLASLPVPQLSKGCYHLHLPRHHPILSLTPLHPVLPPHCSRRFRLHSTRASPGAPGLPTLFQSHPQVARACSMKHTPELDP